MNLVEFNHILDQARDVAVGGHERWQKLNQIDRIRVALIINNPLWIQEDGLSMAEAVDKLGPETCSMLLAAEQALSREITRNT